MKKEDIALQASRLRVLCKCLALTRPEESERWMKEARFFGAYLRDVPEDDAPTAEAGTEPTIENPEHPARKVA